VEWVNIQACFQTWFTRKDLECLRAVPYLVLWGIWLARNASLFEDSSIPTFKVSTQVMGLLPFYKEAPKTNCYKEGRWFTGGLLFPWGHFDGACQGQKMTVGIGFSYFLVETHYFYFKANLGSGTNNLGELMLLYYLMKFSLEGGRRNL
jgi:hypothetical protein